MTKLIELAIHEENVYEIIFHSSNRAAVDEYFSILETVILKVLEDHSTIRAMVNLTHLNALPPIAYITQKGRNLLKSYSDRRSEIHLRSAFVAKSSAQITLTFAQTIINIMPIDATVELFTPEERDNAMAWLLQTSD